MMSFPRGLSSRQDVLPIQRYGTSENDLKRRLRARRGNFSFSTVNFTGTANWSAPYKLPVFQFVVVSPM